MQKIVTDSLRPDGRGDPEGVVEARATLEKAYELLDRHLAGAAGPRDRSSPSPTALPLRRCSTRASCSAGTSSGWTA